MRKGSREHHGYTCKAPVTIFHLNTTTLPCLRITTLLELLFLGLEYFSFIIMMHSLRQLGIPTVAIVSLITISILALVGIGEGFRLLVRRELHNDQRELQKRSGSTLKFTFPWE